MEEVLFWLTICGLYLILWAKICSWDSSFHILVDQEAESDQDM